MSPVTLWAQYERRMPEAQEFYGQAKEEYLLLMMHPSKIGMRLLTLDNSNRTDFSAWMKAFVPE
jgi:hypothetical protein